MVEYKNISTLPVISKYEPGKVMTEQELRQLVLDFSRKEVVDAMFARICSVMDQGNIEYLANAFSALAEQA